jgi:hypothetical protein
MSNKDLTLEEKIDKILKYQTRVYRLQITKFIIGLILFIVIVVLPIVWFVYWIKSFDFTGISEAYENIKEASGGMDKINELLNQL